MQTFIDFLANNYFWFLIISLILIFALIGYLVDTSEKGTKIKRSDSLENQEWTQTTTNSSANSQEPMASQIENPNPPLIETPINVTSQPIEDNTNVIFMNDAPTKVGTTEVLDDGE